MTTLVQQTIIFLCIFYLNPFPFSSATKNTFASSRSYVDTHYHHHHGGSHGHSGGWPSHGHGHGGGGGHGGGFQSFFDIALTGLAFLSFGIFLLNLLLNALAGAGMVTGVNPTNTGTGIITSTATGRGSYRSKRNVPFVLNMDPVTSMEALATSVLESIDAMVHKHECLQKVFCDGNKEAKVIGNGFQYMMPMYSIGASYLGKKFGLHNNFIDHLRATILGYRESNCHSHFLQC